MLNNTSLPELKETPEAFEYLMKFSMLNNFGGAYTLTNLDNESFIEMEIMQLCLVAQAKRQENESKKAQFYSKEGILR